MLISCFQMCEVPKDCIRAKLMVESCVKNSYNYLVYSYIGAQKHEEAVIHNPVPYIRSAITFVAKLIFEEWYLTVLQNRVILP
jgi:hypothetical protein